MEIHRARATRPGCRAGRVLCRQGESHCQQQLLIFHFTFRGFGVPASFLGIFICGVSTISPAALAHTAVVVPRDAYMRPAEDASEWVSSSIGKYGTVTYECFQNAPSLRKSCCPVPTNFPFKFHTLLSLKDLARAGNWARPRRRTVICNCFRKYTVHMYNIYTYICKPFTHACVVQSYPVSGSAIFLCCSAAALTNDSKLFVSTNVFFFFFKFKSVY